MEYNDNGILYKAQGRVEFNNGVDWGTVCDDGFDQNSNAAEVFCRSIGLPSSNATNMAYGTLWATGTGAIVMDDVLCSGTEADLTECAWSSTNNCGHGEDIGVVCEGET